MEGEAQGVSKSKFALALLCWRVASGCHVLDDPEWTQLDRRLAADPVVVDVHWAFTQTPPIRLLHPVTLSSD